MRSGPRGSVLIQWLLMLGLLVFGGTTCGCFTRGLGEQCAREADCKFGLRCFQPVGAESSLCAVGCEDTACTVGECVETDDGQICAESCSSGADCPGDTSCQVTANQTTVCWVDDSHLEPLAEAVQVARVELTNDTDGNGELSAGESARLSVFAKNTGSEMAQGVFATTTAKDNHVHITQCWSVSPGGGTDWCEDDGTICDCENSNYRQDLAPGQTSEKELTRLDIDVAPEATGPALEFAVVFTDKQGTSWDDSFQIQLVTSGAIVEAGEVVVVSDDSGDGQLSPGETGLIGVYGVNTGTADAVDVFAVTSTDSTWCTISECWSVSPGGGTDWCDHESHACLCDEGGYSHDLAAGQTSEREITRIKLVIDGAAPTSPIPFEITFHDSLGNGWGDTFDVEVSP